jgi:hypothetical protein
MPGYVSFKKNAYLDSIMSKCKRILDETASKVKTDMLTKLAGANFRSMDKKHVAAMLSSVSSHTEKTMETMKAVFTGGGGAKPNQSFRAIYYEYGTGNLMHPHVYYLPSKDPYWNPKRPVYVAAPIYSRAPGIPWEDLGGNTHKGKSREEPRPLPNKGIGRPIEPQHWFSDAYNDGVKLLDQSVLDAVKSVPLVAYIGIRDIKKRM